MPELALVPSPGTPGEGEGLLLLTRQNAPHPRPPALSPSTGRGSMALARGKRVSITGVLSCFVGES